MQDFNHVGDEGAFALGDGLISNCSLQRLSLVRYALFGFMLFWLIRLAQVGNDVSFVGVCHIIACTLHNDNLSVHFDDKLLPHVHPYAWLNEGLPVPPDAVLHKKWTHVVKFFHRRVRIVHLQLPQLIQTSFPVQRRHAASLVFRAAAAARPVFNRNFNRHGVHMHLSTAAPRVQESAAKARAQVDDDDDDECYSMPQRLRLMCSSSPLSVVAFRLALSVDRFASGGRFEHTITVHILRRCSSVLAWRLWMGNSKSCVRSVGDREIIHSFTAQQHLKEEQQQKIEELKMKHLMEVARRQREQEQIQSEQSDWIKAAAIIGFLAVAWTLVRGRH